MSLPKQLDRLRRMHRLIKFKRTGTPEQFARKLGISRSLLYRLIGELKAMDAPVYFCIDRQSYAYYESVELQLGFLRVASSPTRPQDSEHEVSRIPIAATVMARHRS
ncbi:hypothetical protein [Lewinella sp. JB7]|uniref:hypothetical protein n=1 Tax=Lewinella sp. JB7 TaxID=2962887 RepID=UPI0020C97A8B|nr:hypothetical protein [Lewinella sp. JB7]MCP9235693.1 hypothetical protein [Lewinella sp. JB7]